MTSRRIEKCGIADHNGIALNKLGPFQQIYPQERVAIHIREFGVQAFNFRDPCLVGLTSPSSTHESSRKQVEFLVLLL